MNQRFAAQAYRSAAEFAASKTGKDFRVLKKWRELTEFQRIGMTAMIRWSIENQSKLGKCKMKFKTTQTKIK